MFSSCKGGPCARQQLYLEMATSIKLMKTEKQQSMAAEAFAKRWQGRGYEKGESQTFWIELLTEVFGVEEPSSFIRFKLQAMLDHTSFIDKYHVLQLFISSDSRLTNRINHDASHLQ